MDYKNYNGIYLKRGAYSYGEISVTGAVENGISIGKFCSIGPGCVAILDDLTHRLEWVTTFPFTSESYRWEFPDAQKYNTEKRRKGITLENDIWIGENVILLGGTHIENGVVVAAGSVVHGKLMSYGVYGGNPAKLLYFRFDEKTIELLNNIQWWNKPINWIKNNMEFLCSKPNNGIIRKEK